MVPSNGPWHVSILSDRMICYRRCFSGFAILLQWREYEGTETYGEIIVNLVEVTRGRVTARCWEIVRGWAASEADAHKVVGIAVAMIEKHLNALNVRSTDVATIEFAIDLTLWRVELLLTRGYDDHQSRRLK